MAQKNSNLKLKNVISYDDEEEKNHESGKLELYLPLEKLNLGPKKKLLVLNLGGLLVHRVHKRDRFIVQNYKPDFVSGNFTVFKRPFCEEFLKFCLERFEVGIWSSAMGHNMYPLLDNIMVGLRKKLVFVWDQGKCTNSGFSTLEKKKKPIYLKQLKKIWENNNYCGRFTKSNTLLIDDEPHVALLNPPNTAIFPPAYKVGNRTDTFLGRNGEMRGFLEELVDVVDVPSYVKGHEFGQPAITSSHEDWDYFAKIIRAVEGLGFGKTDYESDYSY